MSNTIIKANQIIELYRDKAHELARTLPYEQLTSAFDSLFEELKNDLGKVLTLNYE